MKAKKNNNGEWVVTEGEEKYIETSSAQPTNRLLDGSRDHGYWMEYEGHGHIDGTPVTAVYLLGSSNKDIEDEGDYNWDEALANGRLVVDTDAMTDKDWADFLEKYSG